MINKEPQTILLVEDNPAHAELVQLGLERHWRNSHINHVADGKAALEYLFRQGRYADIQQSPRPEIILLDLRLPQLSGFEVLKQIKASDEVRTIPVIVLTTSSSEKDVADAYACCANGYVTKPLEFEAFSALIQALGVFWLEWNRTPKPAPSP